MARWTLLLFYSSTCPACVNLMPVFRKLAEDLAPHARAGGPEPRLHLAQVRRPPPRRAKSCDDRSGVLRTSSSLSGGHPSLQLEKPLNDVPYRGLSITHYPTIYLFKAAAAPAVEVAAAAAAKAKVRRVFSSLLCRRLYESIHTF